jgi:hypothetical protein
MAIMAFLVLAFLLPGPEPLGLPAFLTPAPLALALGVAALAVVVVEAIAINLYYLMDDD